MKSLKRCIPFLVAPIFFNFSFINQGVPTSFSSTVQDGGTIYHRHFFFKEATPEQWSSFLFLIGLLFNLFPSSFVHFKIPSGKTRRKFREKKKFTSFWYFGGDVKWTIDEDWRYETVVLSDWQRKKNN